MQFKNPEGVIPPDEAFDRIINDYASGLMSKRQALLDQFTRVVVNSGYAADWMLVEQRTNDLQTRWWFERKPEGLPKVSWPLRREVIE